MVNITPIIQQALPLIQTRGGIAELCRTAIIRLRQQALRGQLSIRYVVRRPGSRRRLYLRNGHDNGTPAGVGLAYFDPTAPNHIFAGVSMLGISPVEKDGVKKHRRDPWNRYVGQVVAALHYIKVPLSLAMTWRRAAAPFRKSATSKSPKSAAYTGPWQCLLADAVPPAGRHVFVESVLQALARRLRTDTRFEPATTYQPDGYLEFDPIRVANTPLAAELVDKWITLPPITEEVRLARIAEARSRGDEKATCGCDSSSCTDTAKVPA